MNEDYNPVLDDDDDEVVTRPASTSKPLERARFSIPSPPEVKADPEDFFEDLAPVVAPASTDKPLAEAAPASTPVTPAEAKKLAQELRPLVEIEKATELAQHKREWGVTLADDERHEALLRTDAEEEEEEPVDEREPDRDSSGRVRRGRSTFRITEADEAVMDFLERCRYAPYSQLAILLGVSPGSAKNRANRLVKYGYPARGGMSPASPRSTFWPRRAAPGSVATTGSRLETSELAS